ncbi:poly [ADP-ribose] polymerase 2-like [Watersipora subatra]|uniref:poly [ADP-ribose] polymerase 2-like n=1 Tax=Watersipora subatra TaxID=2589382 RepID=UPI00355C8FB3
MEKEAPEADTERLQRQREGDSKRKLEGGSRGREACLIRQNAKAAVTDKAAASSTSVKAKKAAGKAAADLKTKGEKSTAKEAKEKIVGKTILKKGKVPVDPECPFKESMHVYCSDGDIWDCMLNQDLITLIADVKAMEAAVVEMKYDAKKAPLYELTKAQIKQGYSALKDDIETLIKAGKYSSELTEACNAFYTRIPHDFGMKPPERIVSLDTLKAKIDLLEALGDIEIAVNVLKKGDQSIHPIDRMYLSLECDLEPMDKSCDIYKLLQSYLLNTHGSTHNHYSIKLLDIFHCYKDQPSGPDVGNKMLLWHGSRLTNWVRILAKGLRIAPPEAPVTGYVFGKGVYFADCSSKSANYCFPTKMKNVGLLLLNEVTLGQQNELVSSNYHANKLPKGKHSVKGCGKMAPSQEGNTDLDGVTVPCGRLKETGIVNSSGYTLQYHEYIVYNTNQIKMKYLLKVKFNFHH